MSHHNHTWAENKTRTSVTARNARLDELMAKLGCNSSEIAPIDSSLCSRRAGEVIACVSRAAGPRWSDALMLPAKRHTETGR